MQEWTRLRAIIAVTALAASMPASAAPPQSATTYVNSAENRYQKGDVDGALSDLAQAIAADPRNVEAYFERGYITMQRLAPDARDPHSEDEKRRAIADFTEVVTLDAKHARAYAFRGLLEEELGLLAPAIADARQAGALDPSMWLPHRTLVNVYWDQAYLDKTAGIDAKRSAIALGLKEADVAIGLNADDYATVMMKSLLLRLDSTLETDAARQKALVAEADIYRDRAVQLQQRQTHTAPPPAAVPQAPLRVGGAIKPPRKILDARPTYPAIAQTARLQGSVYMDATIDEQGNVSDAVVLRSPKLGGVPVFDRDALAAVRQWKFEPTLIDGKPTSLVMTVTVTFSLQQR